ncbi:MAG: MBL fold metallo-hydrolase [Arenicella sp.]|nr:MBL fold metallo-hydrolase [Arenicella sp.]
MIKKHPVRKESYSINKLAFCSAIGLLVLCSGLNPAQAQTKEEPFILVLGVAQDAGYPQAGCYEPRCTPAWEDANLKQTATSLAVVNPTAKKTILFEATPHLPEQLYALHKVAPSDEYQLSGVFLTHAHIGHYTGLMYFGHEVQGSKNVPVFVMPRMQEFLSSNGPWSQLVELENIQLKPLRHKQPQKLEQISVTPFLVPHRDEYSETVGYTIEGPSKTAVFIPDINKWEKWDQSLIKMIESVDYALIDATFYGQGELPIRDMSQMPHPLVTDTMAKLESLSAEQKSKVWFIHINHTNPLLDENSDASKEVVSKGFNVAREGLRLPL